VAERARLELALDRLPGVARFPSATNFVLIRVAGADAVFERLKARGILVRNLHASHPLLDNCLRLTVGTPDENRFLLDALGASLN
jgi:histidinol-phosphate aminotransferase